MPARASKASEVPSSQKPRPSKRGDLSVNTTTAEHVIYKITQRPVVAEDPDVPHLKLSITTMVTGMKAWAEIQPLGADKTLIGLQYPT